MFSKIPITWKIMMLMLTIMSITILMIGIGLIGNFINLKEEELRERSLITARTVAEISKVKNGINGSLEDRKSINSTVERIRIVNGADYIVVLDMNRIRLSHPVDSMLWTISNSEDESAAFAEHTYTTKAKGEVGTAIRAFVPIMNDEHEQVGVVITGYMLPSFFKILATLKLEIISTLLLSIFFGVWGAWVLSRNIKTQMFHLEPHEIARLLEERIATFNAMHEGVIAIDTNYIITIFNNRAKEILGVSGDVIGKNIYHVIPDTRLPEILSINQAIYNKELNVRNLTIYSNRIPIKVNGKTVGAVAIFQDRTDVKKLAEELTDVKAFVNALRVQNHEHMNKLHTIAGLIQMGNSEKALDYVFQVNEEQQELTQFLSKNIRDESLSGLLLSKVSRGKELGVNVIIDRKSQLRTIPAPLDHHDFVIILGNLIENAFDAFKGSEKESKEIYISIEQDDSVTSILVEDNGCGLKQEVKDKIFIQGVSTKQEKGHGIGLYLIHQIVEKAKGEIMVESDENYGTSFIITFFSTK